MHPLKSVLGHIATGERWQRETRQSKIIQRALKECLPAELVEACQAWLGEAETLTLVCPSGLYASRLRQISPRLVHQFCAQGVEVRAIRIEVQPTTRQYSPPTQKQALVLPTEDVLLQLEELGSRQKSPQLGDALSHLAQTLRKK